MQTNLSKLFTALTPLFLAAVIVVLYFLTSSIFIQCKWGLAGCKRFTVSSAYLENSNPLNKYPSDKSKPSSEIEQSLETKLKEKTEVDEALERAVRQSGDLAKEKADIATALSQANLSAEEKARLEARKTNLDTLKPGLDPAVTALTQKQTKLDEHIKGLQAQLSSIHNRTAKIYWNRAMYATFIALFIIVALASVVIAALTINHAFAGHSRGVRAGALAVTAVLSAGIGIFLYLNSAEYLVVINEVTNRIKAEDVGNIQVVTNVLNAFGYAATTGLLLAVISLLWFPEPVFDKDPTKFERNVELLSQRIKYLRMILYVGTIMLLIAVFRLKAMLDWSVAFLVQSDVSAAQSINQTLVTAQGTFFTLLLAAVYIPAAYIILKQANSLSAPTETNKSEVIANKGLGNTFTSFKEFVPRLTVMLLPFLVGPVADLAKNLFV